VDGVAKVLLLGALPSTLAVPGGAAALRRSAPFGFRYQYLAGGVNTGSGWSTWNPNGSFVTRYDRESWAAGEIPVFSYYMLLQSKPAGGDELQTDLAHLRDPRVMSANWADVRLLFQRARSAKTGRRRRRLLPRAGEGLLRGGRAAAAGSLRVVS
jgi:hypothetical protein